MTIRLTRKRLDRLSVAISMDDVLHEHFRRLNLELQAEWAKLYRAKCIIRIRRKIDGDRYELLHVTDIRVTAEGTEVDVI